MLILGIETSCDETAVSLVRRGEQNQVIGEQVKSQIPLHAPYGGVVPEIASRNHLETIDVITRAVLENAGITFSEIDLLAVTQGPGLIGSLLVGLSFAKGLAFQRRIPLVPVDHIAAHIESAFIDNPHISYPLLALIVSGGHTSLFYQPGKFEYELVAKTRDDAVGEVMDKISKFFGLGYPGGPVLDKLYDSGDPKRFSFTFPRMSDGSNDFSFSGYKTAVLRHARELGISKETRECSDLLSSFLHSVVEYLFEKTKRATTEKPVKSVVVTGGVSRNSLLRSRFMNGFEKEEISLYLPAPGYCTDNATMVAWSGYEKYLKFPQENYFNWHVNAYSRSSFRSHSKFR